MSKDEMNEDYLKKTIRNGGLYEEGMSFNDMLVIYNTLNRSKKTANDDNEYHKVMSQTEINCANVELLKTKTDSTEDNDEDKDSNNSERVELNNIIFNFTASKSFTPFISVKRHKKVIPILYHNPILSRLSNTTKTQIITTYLQYEENKTGTAFTDQWNKPIKVAPTTEFIKKFKITQKSEAPKLENESPQKESESFITLRSNRVVKRKTYTEDEYGIDDDDDDFKPAVNKKSKSAITVETLESPNLNESPSKSDPVASQKEMDSDDLCSPTISKKTMLDVGSDVVITSTPNEKKAKASKWYSKPDVQKTKNLKWPTVSDRTNKLFDKLRKDENKKPNLESKTNTKENANSSDDDIFPDIHTEVTPKAKTEKSRTQIKSRKKLNLRSATKNKEVDIPVTKFYGNNQDNELDISNNNKSSASKMTQCPICSKSFPDSQIEDHAASCEQYENTDEDFLCNICHQYILKSEMDAHKIKCLKKITEDSVEVSNELNKSFLCDVCDQFVVTKSMFEHASNCIAKMKDN